MNQQTIKLSLTKHCIKEIKRELAWRRLEMWEIEAVTGVLQEIVRQSSGRE